jgi:hypothetical protein
MGDSALLVRQILGVGIIPLTLLLMHAVGRWPRWRLERSASRCGACARPMRPLPPDRAARALRPGHRHEARMHGADHVVLGCPAHPGPVTVLTRLPLLSRLNTAVPCATCGFYTLEVRVTQDPSGWGLIWHERCVTCGAEDSLSARSQKHLQRMKRARDAAADRLGAGVWSGDEPPPPDPLLSVPLSSGSTPPMGAR